MSMTFRALRRRLTPRRRAPPRWAASASTAPRGAWTAWRWPMRAAAAAGGTGWSTGRRFPLRLAVTRRARPSTRRAAVGLMALAAAVAVAGCPMATAARQQRLRRSTAPFTSPTFSASRASRPSAPSERPRSNKPGGAAIRSLVGRPKPMHRLRGTAGRAVVPPRRAAVTGAPTAHHRLWPQYETAARACRPLCRWGVGRVARVYLVSLVLFAMFFFSCFNVLIVLFLV